jgi:predicted metal-dependent hydrolase
MPEEPKLDEESARGLARGISEFNAGAFFECHDTLEEVWHGTRGPAREFFQGLIQVAVAFYHLGNSNTTGGRSQFQKAMIKLDSYGREYLRVDLDALRSEVREWIRKVDAGEPLQTSVAELPKIHRSDEESPEKY